MKGNKGREERKEKMKIKKKKKKEIWRGGGWKKIKWSVYVPLTICIQNR